MWEFRTPMDFLDRAFSAVRHQLSKYDDDKHCGHHLLYPFFPSFVSLWRLSDDPPKNYPHSPSHNSEHLSTTTTLNRYNPFRNFGTCTLHVKQHLRQMQRSERCKVTIALT